MINEVLDALSSSYVPHLALAVDLINKLNHAERITVRIEAESQGLPLPRNLYYDYKTQEWIK